MFALQSSSPPMDGGRKNTGISPDFLAVLPSNRSFRTKVLGLELSHALESKILSAESAGLKTSAHNVTKVFTVENEKELASEVLLARHEFTNALLQENKFRQAAITIIQNIYLFNNRKLFFASEEKSTELDRQLALRFFSDRKCVSIPLTHTLQHIVIARIWRRIYNQQLHQSKPCDNFQHLNSLAEKLNTLRNCYMLLAQRLVKKTASQRPEFYRKSMPNEDAEQVGLIGVGRAAYRYHPSCGVRFSTFATNYIQREIQQQALNGKLIRISSNVLEHYAKAVRCGKIDQINKHLNTINLSSIISGQDDTIVNSGNIHSHHEQPELITNIERQELCSSITNAVDLALSSRHADIIKRRFGIAPYENGEQTVVQISRDYGVSRSAIYQQEQTALKNLKEYLIKNELLDSL